MIIHIIIVVDKVDVITARAWITRPIMDESTDDDNIIHCTAWLE